MSEEFIAFWQVLVIDIVLAGDNAIVVGMVASGGLPPHQRRQAILWGIVAATIMRIGFALIATQLLAIVGLTLAGGILLLWVCWKMYRELRKGDGRDAVPAVTQAAGTDLVAGGEASADPPSRTTLRQSIAQILVADVSMSLDNVLAVAGAARQHPWVLLAGLLISVALMGLAANLIAQLLQRHRWIGWVGLLVVIYVALKMIWDGSYEVAERI
jgi:YjbE family integral membrane protein